MKKPYIPYVVGIVTLMLLSVFFGSELSLQTSSRVYTQYEKQIYSMEDIIDDCSYLLGDANSVIDGLNGDIKIANDINQYKAYYSAGIKFYYGQKISTDSCHFGLK